jgi:large subunit ribosomal protein L14e
MMEIGRICVKIAGRDAGKKCVIIEKIDESFVMIDGETRRRKCNLKHLEPTSDTITVKSKADHATIVAEFKKLGIEIKATKSKQKKDKPKQTRAADRKKTAAAEVKKAPAKKEAKHVKKEEKVAEEKKEAEPAPETELEKAAKEE